MENQLVITANVIWVEEITDCRKCYCCEERIYSRMFTLAIRWNDTKVDIMDDITICESCMNVINSD